MALGYAKMFTGNLLGETSMPYETCSELRSLICRLWDERKLDIEWMMGLTFKLHECGSEAGGFVHCAPVGEEDRGDKGILITLVVFCCHAGDRELCGLRSSPLRHRVLW